MRRAVAVLLFATLSASGAPVVSPEEYPGRRQALHLYLTEWNEPGAVLLLLPDSALEPREVLFIADRNPVMDRFTRPKANPSDRNISEITGFKQVEPTKSFESRLAAAFHEQWRVYTVTNQPASERLKTLVPSNEVRSTADVTRTIPANKKAARDYLNAHGKDSNGQPLGKYLGAGARVMTAALPTDWDTIRKARKRKP